MSMDDFGNEVVAQPPRSAVERDAVAHWRGAIAKMGDNFAPQVPVADLRDILKALAAATGERIRICNTDGETCGWVGYESECVHPKHAPDMILCPKCHETTHTAGPGTIKAFRAALAAAESRAQAAEQRGGGWKALLPSPEIIDILSYVAKKIDWSAHFTNDDYPEMVAGWLDVVSAAQGDEESEQ